MLPENDPYSDAETEALAAIFLTSRVRSNLHESVREIKYLVANSVQGLDYDKVSIALFPVAAEDNTAIENVFDRNVSAMGLRMALDAAAKVLTIVIALGILLLCSMGAAIFFFFESRKSRKGLRLQNLPQIAQSSSMMIPEMLVTSMKNRILHRKKNE
jgi:type III secretory pathway lipoprotein EscJ